MLNRVTVFYCAHMICVLCMLAFGTGILWQKALAFGSVKFIALCVQFEQQVNLMALLL